MGLAFWLVGSIAVVMCQLLCESTVSIGRFLQQECACLCTSTTMGPSIPANATGRPRRAIAVVESFIFARSLADLPLRLPYEYNAA